MLLQCISKVTSGENKHYWMALDAAPDKSVLSPFLVHKYACVKYI